MNICSDESRWTHQLREKTGLLIWVGFFEATVTFYTESWTNTLLRGRVDGTFMMVCLLTTRQRHRTNAAEQQVHPMWHLQYYHTTLNTVIHARGMVHNTKCCLTRGQFLWHQMEAIWRWAGGSASCFSRVVGGRDHKNKFQVNRLTATNVMATRQSLPKGQWILW